MCNGLVGCVGVWKVATDGAELLLVKQLHVFLQILLLLLRGRRSG